MIEFDSIYILLSILGVIFLGACCLLVFLKYYIGGEGGNVRPDTSNNELTTKPLPCSTAALEFRASEITDDILVQERKGMT